MNLMDTEDNSLEKYNELVEKAKLVTIEELKDQLKKLKEESDLQFEKMRQIIKESKEEINKIFDNNSDFSDRYFELKKERQTLQDEMKKCTDKTMVTILAIKKKEEENETKRDSL